ncbi:MAG: energy transducer TonB [Planctomycetaceae bacterium]
MAQAASEQSSGGPRQLPVALPDNPSPRYPRRAVSQRRQGIVVLALRVDRDGRVTSATVNKSSGHSDLDQAALVAARAWRFLPARRGDMAVEITVLKPFRFIGRSR